LALRGRRRYRSGPKVPVSAEIAITLADFVVEDRVRRPLGGVYPGERVTHALMGILYGAMLACMAPVMWHWASARSALAFNPAPIPAPLRYLLLMMAAGVVASGLRDLAAALELRGSRWPWRHAALEPTKSPSGGPTER
jgi:hypothetical protein